MERTEQVWAMWILLWIGLSSTSVHTTMVLPHASITEWAETFGQRIYEISAEATAITEIRSDYLVTKPSIQKINGTEMVWQMKLKMEAMLSKKVKAITDLVEVAEKAHGDYHFESDLKIDYPNAKKLNTSVFELESNAHFNYIQVSLNASTVHVPTNVYDESNDVMNGVNWSRALDHKFQENYEKDPTLTWQYFGSALGFFRTYPGAVWKAKNYVKSDIDTYDCRARGWYIQAATSPKDVVILLDVSGSMQGLRMEIAKATVDKILDTLSDDDFFNVIQFAEHPSYLDECFNGSLVQANADNKKRMTEAFSNVKTENIAFFDRGLSEAFELLRSVNESGRGSQCNRAIMLITDGAPETYEELFKKYNSQGDVRVFTFMIGREVGDDKQVRWMACYNKGYYSHISTLADVHEHVQDYIHVLSRPMVIMRANHSIWTSVYLDEAGLELMTSVAQPVFDTRQKSSNKGILLGVMGTDVPLKELTKLTPQYKLGVNGYAFAITNNGYILFHPDFRPTDGDVVKPNYNSVDLAEVELQNRPENESGMPTPFYDMELRRRMVDRETGHLSMDVKIHYDDMRRVTVRRQHYFFTAIEDTPFSLGIAMPEDGLTWLDGTRRLNDIGPLKSKHIKIAPWNYCRMDTTETLKDPIEMLIQYLEKGINDDPDYKDRCDKDLIESLLYDAHTTHSVEAAWRKDTYDGIPNPQVSLQNGIEIVFLGTKAGLTRFFQIATNLTDPDFLGSSGTVEEMYYKRAVEAQEGTFVYSVPDRTSEDEDENFVVTASAPIKLSSGPSGSGLEAVAAVVGLQMRYSSFSELLMNSSVPHPDCQPTESNPCNLTCASQELDCYLLDNSGFVVFSENINQVGKFFGEIDGNLMKELTINDSVGDDPADGYKGIFQKVVLYDYQGLCDIMTKDASSAISIFTDPIRRLFSSLFWVLNEVAILLLQVNVAGWWHASDSVISGQNVTFSPGAPDEIDTESDALPDYYYPDFSILQNLMDGEEMDRLLDHWRKLRNVKTPDKEVKKWFETEVRLNTPRLVGYRHSIMRLTLAKSVKTKQLQTGNVNYLCLAYRYYEEEKPPEQVEFSCSKSYNIQRVPRTNLFLLVIDAMSDAESDLVLSIKPEEVEYTDEMKCGRLQTEIHRRRPSQCYSQHPDEDSGECGRGSSMAPSPSHLFFIISILAATHLLTTRHS